MILERKGKGREREKDESVVGLNDASLVNSCMCPDQDLNPQPRRKGTMLYPTEAGHTHISQVQTSVS